MDNKRVGALLAQNRKFAQLERRVDEFCSFFERVALRALLLGCFIYEASKFVLWMLR
jgi:hypothetical protein